MTDMIDIFWMLIAGNAIAGYIMCLRWLWNNTPA